MIGGAPAGAAVTLTFTGTKDSFLRLTPELRAQLRLEQKHAVEVSWGENPVYLGWMETRARSVSGHNDAELNRQLGETLGLTDGQQVFLKPCSNVSSCKEVTVEPLSPDDWDILELHASALEIHLLDQIRIVYPSAIFPVWVDPHTCIYIQIGALSPVANYGRLEPLTELIVSPKIWDFENISSRFSPQTNQELYGAPSNVGEVHKQMETPESGRESASTEGETRTNAPDNSDYSSTVTSMWDSLGNFLLWTLGKKPSLSLGVNDKDLFERTSLRCVRLEAVFRVSSHIPHNIQSSPAYTDYVNNNTVHVFLWYPEPSDLVPDVVVTYGKITELPSPKRHKEHAKNRKELSEKKTEPGVLKNSKLKEVDINSPVAVVKIVWHGFEDLKDVIEYDTRNGNTHTGKIWVPESLRKKLHIDISSAVRVQTCESRPRIPTSLTLQPRQTLDTNISEEEIKSAFNSWLQSSSTLTVPWISGKTDHVQFLVKGEMEEFLVNADHSSDHTGQDDVFMLCPSFLQKTKIHVVSQPAPSEESPKAAQTDRNLPYLTMHNLGGVDNLVVSCYEHIVHCLMGRPLSRQLFDTSSGLRSGAILLSGPKGSGKSTLAKALCKEAFEKLEAHVEEIDCKLLKGKTFENIRQTLEEAFGEAAWRQPSVLLLDDLDHIVGVPSTPELEQSPEAIQSKHLAYVLKNLMKEIISMDTLFAVIATSQSDQSLNPMLISEQGIHLFQCLKSFQPPTQEQRCDMLRCVIKNRLNKDMTQFKDVNLQSFARETEGFVARDFTMLVERAIESSVATRKTSRKQDLDLSTSDFQKALKGFTPLSLRKAQLHKPKSQGWNMVGGLHGVRQILKDTIELPAKYPELFANLPIRHRSGVLLYGAPGTGKTLLAGVVAHESGMNFISIKGPELLSKYIGASEQAMRDVFTRAQAAKPCILFFDEFDSIAPRRGHDNTGVTDRVVNQMLTQLDGVEGLEGVYVLAATSRPDLIDPALLRPGRLDECLYCPPPDQMSRFEILKGLSHSLLLDDDVDFKYIAALTEHFTGADLKALLYNAQLEAIHTSQSAILPQENCSGSDSDTSMSSIIFLNNSSGSDDSGGEPECALEQSLLSLDIVRLPPEDLNSNMWRLYFGSSYESDLGNGSSDQENQTLSQTDMKRKLYINQRHLMSALASTRPSISQEDWKYFNNLYENFQNPKKSSGETFRSGQKVTLA
ncbi:peroxisomal ATPase PEX1 isoform 2-T2 [Rhinophrynus dorsalis]